MKKSSILRIVVIILALILIWGGIQQGAWWMSLPGGLLLGLALKPMGVALCIALFAGAIGWGLPLLIMAWQFPVVRTASVVAALLGLGESAGWILIAATTILGMALCGSGAWLGNCLRHISEPALHSHSSVLPVQAQARKDVRSKEDSPVTSS